MKYIYVNKLIDEIERFSSTEYGGNTLGDDVARGALDYVLEEIIPSLQQEQPEVDLEEEINKFFDNVGMPVYWCNDAEQREFCSNLARHFWNMGYNARKED